MRYDVTDSEWQIIDPVLPRGSARAEAEERSPGDERHLLSTSSRCAVARFARTLRSLYDDLQSLQSLAQSRHLRPPDGCRDGGS